MISRGFSRVERKTTTPEDHTHAENFFNIQQLLNQQEKVP